MLTTKIIAKTRDCIELSADEIQHMVNGITDGSIPDYQISAWAMAVLCRGISEAETATLTTAMLDSGQRLPRCSDRPRVDKHSTGGLGDKTSLILAPLLACFDLDVPMLSGRGLGITGGTLDKLEAYPGYRCNLSIEEVNKQLNSIGCVITGTTQSIAPADKKLYALRDVSSTVPSVALITASIMSKKLAETLDALVLDVKWGSGAFMQTIDKAKELQASLVRTGRRVGVATSSLLTDMNQPLGKMVGNACEVNESMEVLEGQGPEDVTKLTVELCIPLLVDTKRAANVDEARRALHEAIQDGQALDRYRTMIEAQGGKFADRLPLARVHEVTAGRAGYIDSFDGQSLGHCVVEMGGGRRQQQDPINHQVGLEMLAKIGTKVEVGQPIIRFFFDGSSGQVEQIANQIAASVSIMDQAPPLSSLIVNH
ncbi:MAG: thymidine phosphorylase [Pirellulales bacterium]